MVFNLLPQNDDFTYLSSLLKTLWEKKKNAINQHFLLFHTVFHPLKEKFMSCI